MSTDDTGPQVETTGAGDPPDHAPLGDPLDGDGGGSDRERAPRTLGEAGERIVHLERWLTAVDDLLATTLPPTQNLPAVKGSSASTGASAGAAGEEWVPVFGSLAEFVEEFLVVAFARTLGGPAGMWCAKWWDHTEAILRLEALWRTFEAARLDPNTGMAVWLAQHLDHHLPILLSGTGPFGQCRPDEHRPPPPLPSVSAPDGWWDPMTATAISAGDTPTP